jgi:hypothetical protein
MIQLVPIVLAQVALIAGGPVTVQCRATVPQSGLESYGAEYSAAAYADLTAHTIVIENSDCRNVNSFARKPTLSADIEVWSGGDASRSWSMQILLHETQHFAHPDYSEAQVNCASLALLPRFARTLGANVKTSRLAKRYARMWIHDEEPPQYQSTCTA